MDFIDVLRQFADQATKQTAHLLTEEATKMTLILPFFSTVLGWNVFDPCEFVPEFTADVGVKKNEKVDYAIKIDGQPTILIEAKWCGEKLEKHDSQLFRYFGTSQARFAILTNGILYRFYTDLEKDNVMDLTPFLEIDLANLKENLVPELKKFHKAQFNAEEIAYSASDLKYTNEIKQYFAANLKDPSDEFVRLFTKQSYAGAKTQAVLDKFKPLVQKALTSYINEAISDRLNAALMVESTHAAPEPQPTEAEEDAAPIGSRIITTDDELEAFYTIKAMLRKSVDLQRISYKDTSRYFAVVMDDRPNRWICRLKLDGSKWLIMLPGEGKNVERFELESINDLFQFETKLIELASQY